MASVRPPPQRATKPNPLPADPRPMNAKPHTEARKTIVLGPKILIVLLPQITYCCLVGEPMSPPNSPALTMPLPPRQKEENQETPRDESTSVVKNIKF